jgi:hypothetical protein
MPAKHRRKIRDVLLNRNLTLSQRAVFALINESTKDDPGFTTTIDNLAELLVQSRNSAANHLNALYGEGYLHRRIILGGTPDIWRVRVSAT